MVHAGADDHRTLAFGLLSSRGPFARKLNHRLLADSGPLLLPRRGVGLILIVVVNGVVTAESAIDAKLGHQQIVNCGDQHLAFVRIDPFRRHTAMKYTVRAKLGKRHINVLRVTVDERQLRIDWRSIGRILWLEVPLALGLAPAMTC